MKRDKKQVPDFRYITIGEDTYYVPAYIKAWTSLIALAIGLASPVIVLAIVAWSFMA